MFVAPPRSLGLVNSPQSSWITGPLFLKILDLAKKHSRSSKEDRTTLLMDNYESQCGLDSILYVRGNFITLVNFPPRCSNRLHPLDVKMMRTLKEKLRVAQLDWMTANPGNRYQSTWYHLKILHIKLLLLRRIKQQLLLRMVYGNSQDLPSVTRMLNHHLLHLWKNNFVAKRSLFLLLAPL